MIASINSIKKALIVSAAAVALIASVPSSVSSLSQQEKDSIVALHNQYRNAVSPPAADMKPMVWDDSIASIATDYAAKCVTTHSHRPGYGENLAWGWPSQTVEHGLSMWEAEKSSFNINGSPISCGHYTQMVWASSSRVGCAKQTCPNLSGQGQGDIIVCNYADAGNYLNAANLISAPYQVGQATQQQSVAAAPSPDTYHWTGGDAAWSECSASCGQGTQTRSIACVNQDNAGQDWSKCDQNSKPSNSQSCNSGDCPAPKVETPALTSTAPAQQQEDNSQSTSSPVAAPVEVVTYSWKTGDYTQCSAACSGSQTRSVQCVSSNGDVSADSACGGDRPESVQSCNSECPKEKPKIVEQPKETVEEILFVAPTASETVESCSNTTLIEEVEKLFHSSEALNANGLIRSKFDENAPLSLNCTAVFYYLNASSLLNCPALEMSSAINATGGFEAAAYALGDCFDSFYNRSFGFVNQSTHAQTHFGKLNFTRVEFESDYNMTLYNASHSEDAAFLNAFTKLPNADSTEDESASTLSAALPSADPSAGPTRAQLEFLQRYAEIGASSASTSTVSIAMISIILILSMMLL